MTGALHIVQALVSLSFLALGLFTVIDWLAHRERSRGYLALGLGSLGLTSVASQLSALAGYQLEPWIGDLTVVLFMTAGYALLLFRDSLIPLRRSLRLAAFALTALVTVFALAVSIPQDPSRQPTPVQSAASIALVLVWSACVVDPILRFWGASR